MRRFAAISLLILAGCAATPGSIEPAYTSPAMFSGLTCDELGAERTKLDAALVVAERRQNRTRTADNFGVALIGLPVGSLSGRGRAQEIAQIKGQIQAVSRETERRCSAPSTQPKQPS